MKKIFVFTLSFCSILAFTSCKSSESAYKKAYEKAVTEELAGTSSVPVEMTPVVTQPEPAATPVQPVVNTEVREEKVTYVSGNEDLKAFSIVSGSFSLKTNAEGLKEFLVSQGYNATIAFNEEKATYRVIVDSFNDRDSAARARDAFKAKYPERADFQGAWLLYRRY